MPAKKKAVKKRPSTRLQRKSIGRNMSKDMEKRLQLVEARLFDRVVDSLRKHPGVRVRVRDKIQLKDVELFKVRGSTVSDVDIENRILDGFSRTYHLLGSAVDFS